MAVPTLTVEIAFGDGPLDTAPSWTDVSAYVRTPSANMTSPVTIYRGRPSELDTFVPGTCTLTLNNRAARFDPRNTSGPYYGNLVPGVPLRVRGTWSATPYTLFQGFVESWPMRYAAGKVDATVELTAVDALSLLPTLTQPDAMLAYVAELGGAEIYLRTCDGTTWRDWSGNDRHATLTTDYQAPVRVTQQLTGWKSYSAGKVGVRGPATSKVAAQIRPPEASTATPTTSLAPGLSGDAVNGGIWETADIAAGSAWTLSFWYRSELRGGLESIPETDRASATGGIDVETHTVASQAGQVLAQLTNNAVASVTGTSLHVPEATVDDYVPGAVDGLVHHVAVTCTGSTSFTLYYDGVSSDTGTLTGAVANWLVANMADRYYWYGSGGSPPTGSGQITPPQAQTTMQDVIVFGRQLTVDEIGGIIARGIGRLTETPAERAERLLDAVGWPSALQDISTTTYGTCDEYLASGLDTLSALNEVAATEQGRLFVSADGKVTLHGRYYQWDTTAGSTVQATISDVKGAGIEYLSMATDLGRRDIRNAVTVVATAGTSETASDSASITAHGQQSSQIETLLPPTDESEEAEGMATALLAANKSPQTRFAEPLVCRPTTATWAAALGLEIGDRVSHTITPPGGSSLTQHFAVESIGWRLTSTIWLLELGLAPIPFTTGTTGGYLVVGDATFGVIGTARVGY